MTLAEKLHEEGKLEGKLEGKFEGLSDAIELGMTLKFPDKVNEVMAQVKEIEDINVLIKIKEAIKTARDYSEILPVAAGRE